MNVQRITKEELKQKIDRKEDFVIVDLRNPAAYNSPVKIKGALRMTMDEIESLSGNLPKGKDIITYCT